jgi:hypothetical protein
MRQKFVFMTLLAVLCGCGGGTGASVPATGGVSSTATTATSSPDDPISAAAAAAAPRVTFAGTSRVSAPLDFYARRALAGPRSTHDVVTGDSTHQDAGVQSNDTSGSPVSGVRAFHSVYSPAAIDLEPSGGLTQFLYAPTTKGPNGDCLEFGTAYVDSGGGTSANFYVFDFCVGGFELSIPIDANFMSTYTRERNGFTVYNAETIQGSGTWYALLYNYARHRWECVYTTSGTAGNNFWSIFEFYFNPGPCPPQPTFVAQDIRFYDPTQGTWNRTTPNDGTGVSQTLGPPGSCFIAPATYHITFPDPNYNWHVTSKG